MAVTQISKIQIRRGFQADLGNLAGGEFGWAVDTQRLFIGNGTTGEGAPVGGITEVLTEAIINTNQLITNYTYKGFLGGYEVVTGIDTTQPIIRSLQDKIDDIVNVRDFGVTGLGSVDDTAAIQRAIYELYDRYEVNSQVKTRRRLRFNAGRYLIEGELKIPPYLSIEGEGIENTVLIVKTPARFITSTGDNSSEVVSPTVYPRAVNIRGLTIQSEQEINLIRLDGTTDTVFDDVAFVGPMTQPNDDTTDSRGVWLSSNSEPTNKIIFSRCTFRNLVYGVYVDSVFGTSNIEFNNCKFKELAVGITTQYTTSPEVRVSDIKIYSSLFEDIHTHAIEGAAEVSGIISLANTYKNVGSFYQGDTFADENSNFQPIIKFQADNNYSIADIFFRTKTVSKLYPRVAVNNFYRVVTMSIDEYFALGTARNYAGHRVVLVKNQSFDFDIETDLDSGIINYSMTRGLHKRTGILKFVRMSESTDITYETEYVETENVGVELGVSVDSAESNQLKLFGSTDDAIDSNVILSFDIKNLS